MILLNDQHKNTLFIFIICVIIYSYAYEVYPARPGINFWTGAHEDLPGWQGWADQGVYYKMSSALANGTFSATDYAYPAGYIILAVPFVLLGKINPIFSEHRFFVPDLIILLMVVYMVFNLTYRLTHSIKFSILALSLLFFLTTYLQWFVEPWTIHVDDVGILGIFYILFQKSDKISGRKLMIASLLAGWIFSARDIDVIWSLPLFVIFLIFNPKKFKYLIPGIALVGLVFLSQFVYFGNPLTFPYLYEEAKSGVAAKYYESVGYKMFNWDLSTMGNRVYCILVDPIHCVPTKTGDQEIDNFWYYSLFDKTPVLASASAFLIFSPLGIFLLLLKCGSQQRWTLLMLLVGFFMAALFYTALYGYMAGATRFWRYHIFWFPLFTIFSIYGMNHIYHKIKFNRTSQ